MRIDDSNAEMYRGGFAKDHEPLTPDTAFYIRPITLRAGESHAGHSHFVDHVGNLLSGQARIEWAREDGSESGVIEMLVPAKLLIRADTYHKITALTDLSWECWFARADAERLTEEQGRSRWYLEKEHG